MAEAAKERPGSMAAILGLDDEVVERLCRKILGVWPANYNCPGQIVVSGENDAVDELCAKAEEEGARRTVKLKVSGAFHSPLVARAAERLRPAVEAVKFGEPQAAFMSTVTARFEEAQRMGALLVDQLTAPVRFTQAASRARQGRREDVRRGRPGQRALRADEADRPQREGDLGQRPRLAGEAQGAPAHRVSSDAAEEPPMSRDAPASAGAGSGAPFCSLEGKLALVTGASRGIGRAIAAELARAGASVVVGYRSGAEEAEALAAEIGGRAVQADVADPEQAARLVEEAGDLDILVNNAGLTRDGLILRMSDEDWRTVLDTNLGGGLLHLPRGGARDDEEACAGRSST